jgi:phosphoglycerol transferase MdoB-like AlkP superfamily enzyme
MPITQQPRSRGRALVGRIAELILIALSISAGFIVLEYSAEPALTHIASMEKSHILLNLMTLCPLWALMIIVSNRVWLGCLLGGALTGLIAIANYYVLMFHGLPLSATTLRNFTTAMNVISSYDLTPDRTVWTMIAGVLAIAVVCIVVRLITGRRRFSLGKTLLRDAVMVASCAAMLFFGYFGANPMKPSKTISWLWSEAYYKYGYAACTVESFCNSQNIQTPEGYSADAVDSIDITGSAKDDAVTPDIILILNETLYDIGQVTDLDADAPYLANIETLDNALTGQTVVPRVGGGTNNSEYELLTSNSQQLMPMLTPFNDLGLDGANSIVSHLESLGYNTFAAHSSKPENYMRAIGYPALGFDSSYFRSSFTKTTTFGSRSWYPTDESVYNNAIRWYEEMPEDSPRFAYVLTIQNHSNYDFNDPEDNTVHAQNDFGDNDSSMDEFLSCISVSDQAFKGLTDYFSQSDRPVIICMVGDHCPPFAANIADENLSSAEKNLLLRQTPMVVWSNFEMEDRELGVMSMNMVVPTLLDLAGVETTPYYDYLLQLKKDVPILTSYGLYFDAEGNCYEYSADDGSPYAAAVDQYFLMEYNNLQKNRRQELFAPYAK